MKVMSDRKESPWNVRMTKQNIEAYIVDAIGGGLCKKHGKYYGHGSYGLRACPLCDIDEHYKKVTNSTKVRKQKQKTLFEV